MATRVAHEITDMKQETIEKLQDIVRALIDSAEYHMEICERLNDDFVKKVMMKIANQRREVCSDITSYVNMAGESAPSDGTFAGSLRTIWSSVRSALNSGDTTVVLIEAEKAEDVLVNKFKSILPEIAGNPVNDRLMQHYETVRDGHDKVLTLRNHFQENDG